MLYNLYVTLNCITITSPFCVSFQWRPILNTSLKDCRKPQLGWTGPVSFLSETIPVCDHRPWWGGVGGRGVRDGPRWEKMMEKKKRKSGLKSYLCVENLDFYGTKGPWWGEMLVIRGQRVDDVITIAPTNLVLYIIILPFLSHVDRFPATASPPSDFVLWMVHSTCNLM